MPRLPARALRFLRLCALMMLVLSMLVRPMMEQLGGTHANEHAALAAAHSDHGHGHGHEHGHDSEHPDRDTAKDPEHAKGFHGLMHQAEGGAAATLAPVWSLTWVTQPAASPPFPDASEPRLGMPATLFRPPIA